MRRKSARNIAKTSEPSTSDTTKRVDTPRKPTRSSRRRKRSVSKSDESEDERLSTIKEAQTEEIAIKHQSDEDQAKIDEQKNDEKPLNLLDEHVKQETEIPGELNEMTEESQGKSKELNNSQNENSSNNIEPETENEHVQGTPQSPSKDNADQKINDLQNEKADSTQPEEELTNKVHLEIDNSSLAVDNENVDENSQTSLKYENRSLTPEIKDKKKITLRRMSNETLQKTNIEEPPNEESATTEENNIDTASTTIQHDKEPKPTKKITLKRRADQDKNEEIIISPQPSTQVTELKNLSNTHEDAERNKTNSSSEEVPQQVEVAVKLKPSLKKIRLIRNFFDESKDGSGDLEIKPRRKTITGSSEWLGKISESLYKVDVESIKIVCPKLAFLKEEDVKLDTIPPKERIKLENAVKRKLSAEDSEHKEIFDDQQSSNDLVHNRKISIMDDNENNNDVPAPPSPAKNPPSEVLFITNLVRPFTVKQLRELLEKTGTIVQDGFWTDRIKSKCYVRYASIEEAETTRNALHGQFWPIGNGKKLSVDFSTFEEMDKIMNPPIIAIPELMPEKENMEPERELVKSSDIDLEKPVRKRDQPVREWDIGKEEQHRRPRSRTPSREKSRRHSRRSYTPEINRKRQKRSEEPVSQKLMDDLFLKTKATPSIYWQPLSPEEIAKKVHQRLVRMEEHKRRIEETRDRARETRRNSYRRR